MAGAKGRNRRRLVLVSVLLVLGTLFLVTGCTRPTDVLKELQYNENATLTNDDPLYVNTPYSEETTDKLPAIDKMKTAAQKAGVQHIEVYGKEPTSAAATRHTIFDTDPLFEGDGVESSDAVKLYESNSNDAVDETVEAKKLKAKKDSNNTDKKNKTDSDKTKDKKSKDGKSNSDSTSSNKGSSKAGAKKGGGSSKKGDNSNRTGNPEEGDGGTGNKGAGTGNEDEGDNATTPGGYGAKSTYTPGEEVKDPPEADQVAAIGQAAILVQAIGGKGALCAMDTATYNGNYQGKAKAGSFKKVFGDELEAGFSSSCLLWKKDGTNYRYIKDIDKLVEACGENGVIVLPQDDVDTSTYFSKAQAAKIDKYNITVMPVSFRDAQSIEEAATAIGKVLKNSSKCAQDSVSTAKQYRTTFDNIISACADTTNEGKLSFGGYQEVGGKTAGTYSAWSGGFSRKNLYCTFATDYDDCEGVTYSNPTGNSIDVDLSSGLLFGEATYANSPLTLFGQAAGVTKINPIINSSPFTTYGKISATTVSPLWQYYGEDGTDVSPNEISASGVPCEQKAFSGYSSDSLFSDMPYTSYGYQTYYTMVKLMSSSMHVIFFSNENFALDTSATGLGTPLNPYLIVSGTDEYTGKAVKKNVIESSETKRGAYYTWSLNKNVDDTASTESSMALDFGVYDSNTGDEAWTSIGNAIQPASGTGGNIESIFGPQDDLMSIEDNVRVNPTGLLCKWTQGSVESVLESVWLSQVYSEGTKDYLGNSEYEPSYSMDDFQVKIDGETCSSLKEAVQQFYASVYRCPASQGAWTYSDLVVDE
jgi:hypothetical protein